MKYGFTFPFSFEKLVELGDGFHRRACTRCNGQCTCSDSWASVITPEIQLKHPLPQPPPSHLLSSPLSAPGKHSPAFCYYGWISYKRPCTTCPPWCLGPQPHIMSTVLSTAGLHRSCYPFVYCCKSRLYLCNEKCFCFYLLRHYFTSDTVCGGFFLNQATLTYQLGVPHFNSILTPPTWGLNQTPPRSPQPPFVSLTYKKTLITLEILRIFRCLCAFLSVKVLFLMKFNFPFLFDSCFLGLI